MPLRQASNSRKLQHKAKTRPQKASIPQNIHVFNLTKLNFHEIPGIHILSLITLIPNPTSAKIERQSLQIPPGPTVPKTRNTTNEHMTAVKLILTGVKLSLTSVKQQLVQSATTNRDPSKKQRKNCQNRKKLHNTWQQYSTHTHIHTHRLHIGHTIYPIWFHSRNKDLIMPSTTKEIIEVTQINMQKARLAKIELLNKLIKFKKPFLIVSQEP